MENIEINENQLKAISKLAEVGLYYLREYIDDMIGETIEHIDIQELSFESGSRIENDSKHINRLFDVLDTLKKLSDY